MIQCERCVMDETASEFEVSSDGCNFCDRYLERRHVQNQENKLTVLIEEINKVKGQFNCIVGVSGGIDSSYTLHRAKSLGLRPLAVHMDNTWNTDLATRNISNLVEKLNVPLYTHVIASDEYNNLLKSFIKADVVDLELLYDNAMLAVVYNQAKKHKIRHILFGYNTVTEGIPIPKGWNSFKLDAKNIKNINKRFGNQKLKTFPIISSFNYKFSQKFLRIQHVPFLNYVEFDKSLALKLLQDEYEYVPYPYKHYESILTRFYQGYILPEKFGYDKRKPHLSALIMAGEMSRDTALDLLSQKPYRDEDLNQDKKYFLENLNMTEHELMSYIMRDMVPHEYYGTEAHLFELAAKWFVRTKKILLS